MFHVGQKVVCVDDDPRDLAGRNVATLRPSIQWPVKGHVYTIEAKAVHWNMPVLKLIEIKNGPGREKGRHINEIGFAAARFRPVVERKTDISVFKAMLNLSKVDA